MNLFLRSERQMNTPGSNRRTDSLLFRCLVHLFLLPAFILWTGCGKKQAPPPPEPTVTVCKALQKTVPVFFDYIGSTESVRSVDIRARVEGFLASRKFVEGDEVKQGAVVFVIDKRPFEAALGKSLGQMARDKAQVDFTRLQMERYRLLAAQDFVSKEKYDDWATQYEEALAAVAADKAQVVQDRLNLSWCTMTSPLDGRIGITYVHVGNLVGAGEDTKLATIVQLDPIYVYFSPSVNQLQTILKYKKQAPMVKILFPDGTEHPYAGTLDFVNNQADRGTSTVMLRAVVPNPEKTLLPGQYVTAHLFVTDAPDVILVPKPAVSEDQRGSYVYVVDKQNKIEYRPVEASHEYKQYRVIKKGLKQGESVVIDGQQKVRPGLAVKTETASSQEKRKQGAGAAVKTGKDPGSDEKGGRQTTSNEASSDTGGKKGVSP